MYTASPFHLFLDNVEEFLGMIAVASTHLDKGKVRLIYPYKIGDVSYESGISIQVDGGDFYVTVNDKNVLFSDDFERIQSKQYYLREFNVRTVTTKTVKYTIKDDKTRSSDDVKNFESDRVSVSNKNLIDKLVYYRKDSNQFIPARITFTSTGSA